MSSFKDKFNTVEEKEVVQLNSLSVGKPYPVLSFRLVSTKFGKRLLVELEEAKVFLPECYGTVFTEEEIQEINKSKKERYSIILNEEKDHGVFDIKLI